MANKRFSTWFEDNIAGLLKEITLTQKAKHYRYPDKKAAGKGYANRQPADFFLLLEGVHFDLECKTSEVEVDFVRCYKKLVSDHQMAAARKSYRAGGRYYFLFTSKLSSCIEVWDSMDLIEAYATPRVIPMARPKARLHLNCKPETFAEQLLNKD